MTDKPRLGPWLRQYDRQQEANEDRPKEVALAIGAGIVGLAALVGLVWLFLRAPLLVFASLVGIWGLGLLMLVVKRRRASLRDMLLREGHGLDEIRKSLKE